MIGLQGFLTLKMTVLECLEALKRSFVVDSGLNPPINLPIGNFSGGFMAKSPSASDNTRSGTPADSPTPLTTALTTPLTTTQAVGTLLRQRRRALALTQSDVARQGHTGQRFVIDLERGKPTVQLQKVLTVLDLLGLELVIQPKADAPPATDVS